MSTHSFAKKPQGAGPKFFKNAVRVSHLRIANSTLLQRISVAPRNGPKTLANSTLLQRISVAPRKGSKTFGAISKKPHNFGSKKAVKLKKATAERKAKKPKFAQEPKKSMEELDRELDEYMSHGKVVKISGLLSSLGLN
ncbi:hypothetical protein L596_020044 [Steinernema carpocapsae]|uniref:Uncharacterized protein n=1 Tax=Steinernema carpocapsae TaxID=34508 RepID=A0A4U5MSD2_STECR|nr:hypothetical protein L596_020044 [Steinernema carpocapsae]